MRTLELDPNTLRMTSPTKGKLSIDRVADEIVKYVSSTDVTDKIQIIVGTDSQNFNDTKMVNVIAVRRVGKGGIFFYNILRMDKITNLKDKLYTETSLSLSLANSLIDALAKIIGRDVISIEDSGELKIAGHSVSFGIHVDAGYNGPTKAVISEITSWVNACGYGVAVKPESFVASSIADKYSK